MNDPTPLPSQRPRLGRGLRDLTERLAPLQRGWRFVASALLVGLLPLLVCAPLGLSWHQPISGLLLTVLVWSALGAGRYGAALGAIGLAFATHSALAIALAASWPEQAALLLPDGAAYWGKQQAWILTGHDPEYELASWLPIHVQLLGACLVLAPLSLGLAVFARGFYEVDLMNYYVGCLWRESQGAWGALAVGWHPWSLCRGLCYTLLATELVGLVIERLTGSPPPARRARGLRLALALGFFLADCVIKSTCTAGVRGVLYASLTGS